MKEFTLTKNNGITSGETKILSVIDGISKNPNELEQRVLKQSIFDFSFSLLEKGMNKLELKKTLSSTFKQIKQKGFDIKKVIRNDNIENSVLNIVINYHIKEFQTTESKIQKDIHFSKVHELLEPLINRIAQKENMGNYDEDLVAAGTIGLLKSMSGNFDYLKADFTTYSYMKIRKEIQDEKGKTNIGYNMPNIHNYYYSTYAKIYKKETGSDQIDYNLDIVNNTVAKLKEGNAGVTKRLIKDIVFHKLNGLSSLDNECGSEESGMKSTLMETIESDFTSKDLTNQIDNSILKEHLNNFLGRYPDYEKTLLERKFGFDFGGDNSYPVYEIKVTRNGKEEVKEMVAMKTTDAIKRVQMLGYEVLSTRKEIDDTRKYETVVGGSLERLRDYFEIKKLTNVSTTALKKSETKIVKQLEDYLESVLKAKGIKDKFINVNV